MFGIPAFYARIDDGERQVVMIDVPTEFGAHCPIHSYVGCCVKVIVDGETRELILVKVSGTDTRVSEVELVTPRRGVGFIPTW